MSFGDVEAGPFVDNEGVMADQFFEVFPAVDILEAVGADDDREPFQREFFCEVGKRVDGIGRFGQAEFYIAGPELEVVLNGELHEVEAGILVQKGLSFLEGVLWGNYEPDLVNFSIFYNMIGYNKMADVDGIKAAEIQPNMHGAKLR